jgi:hypothetical protein
MSPLRVQIQLVNDDEKFTCYSPQGPTGATALLKVLKKPQSCPGLAPIDVALGLRDN